MSVAHYERYHESNTRGPKSIVPVVRSDDSKANASNQSQRHKDKQNWRFQNRLAKIELEDLILRTNCVIDYSTLMSGYKILVVPWPPYSDAFTKNRHKLKVTSGGDFILGNNKQPI